MNKKYYLIILLLACSKAFSQISFLPFVNKWTESWPEVVKIGDVNNDGLNDVVLGLTRLNSIVHPNDYSILVYLQNTDGTLADPVRYSYEDNYKEIVSIDIGDLNQDGMNDILVGLQSPVSFSKYGIFYQNSNHTLNPLVSTPVTSRLERVRIGDMNNDGINDIIVSIYQSILFLYQNTPGNFQQSIVPKPYLFNQPVTMSIMEIGDMNNDGRNDLIMNAPAFYKMFTYLQTNYQTINNDPVVFNSQGFFEGMGIGDLNNDGKKDVVLSKAVNYESKIRILHQTTDNNLYVDNGQIPAYELPGPIKVADLNNDGKNEIITVHGGWENVTVYSQNSSGDYGNYQMFPLPYASSYNEDGISIGDINNDGKKDIVIANYNRGIDILYNISSIQLTTEELQKTDIIKIFPNPTVDILYIKGNLTYNTFEIYDNSGRKVQFGNIKNNQINVENLSSGTYILKLKSNKTREYSIHFIKR